ncbi:MAG TPA: beta-galactosidase trimerization domain-containing protein, partial [Microlunatus sp.]|nr:beta-galactosidase trimerization domain-containing protein [Microlunatus sp.]
GGYHMDGSRTERSEAMKQMAVWANAPEQADLWRSTPVRGDVGIVYLPDSQLFAYAQQGHTAFYARAAEGAYAGFLAANIQADWVHIDHIDEYQLLYLPYPIMVSAAHRDQITAWVRAGGTLISEGCPGYFGDGGRVAYQRPGWLEELFGAEESYVEFTPDLLEDLELTVGGSRLGGSTFLQAYRPTTGTASGWYDDGRVAAVDHEYGSGRTRLVGTFPGAGFSRHAEPGRERFFADLLDWAGREQLVRISDRRGYARLADGDGGRFLWVLNPTREAITPTITLGAGAAEIGSVTPLRSATATVAGEHTLEVSVPARDAGVFRLD